ncbi:YvaD family protein [Bacillus sp. DX4.1]|uniref:YvaD family protein n=1 Tax=Bacillus sp. DX4.1 TaxID=3055867 RepID=UPI0025A0441E|nr:YvaD family protein [Bacillus sp. DX4.1]MDM5189097.1 YvaD family protein [Bacillus sp. DX4.1]
MKRLKYFFLITDIGFIIYWLVTVLQIIPPEYLFKDYQNSILVAWNWSFLPLDLLISLTGLISLYLYVKQKNSWSQFAFISLILTFCSGLQAIAFWMIRLDFDPSWWIPNLYLLIYPCFFLKGIWKECGWYRESVR